MFYLLKNTYNVVAFQDDILVHTDSEDQHYHTLDKGMSILNERGMTVHWDKCKFLATVVEYLGHTISGKGIAPKKDSLKPIRDIVEQSNKDQLR